MPVPTSVGDVGINGTISNSTGQAINWTIDVLDKTYTGTGTSVETTWDGNYANGTAVEPGTYSAILTVTTADGICNDSKTINFTVVPTSIDKNKACRSANTGSSADTATGSLSHSQDLFSSNGGALPIEMSLYYNSLDPHNDSLGRGWSHNYDYTLTVNNIKGTVLITEPNYNYEFFTPSNGSYAALPGNLSTLVKNADGTFRLTHPDGQVYTFTDGDITSIADRNGNTTTFVYSGDNLATVTDPLGRVISFAYDSSGNLTLVTDPTGNAYSFSVGDTLSSVTQPDGGIWRYTYDTGNYMLTKTDPLGNVTTYIYDDKHRLISSIDPLGQSRGITYPTTTGKIRSSTFTEKDGGTWIYTYDTTTGTLTSKTDPLGNSASFTYDSNGNMLTRIEPGVGTTSYNYDSQGNATSVTNPLNQTVTYTYNALGQVLTETGAQGTTTNTYDAKGNLLTSTDPAGATTTYEYDTKGNRTKITNAKNQVTIMTYNTAGLLASTTDQTGAVTSYAYNAMGNMLTNTDAAGRTTTFTYDGMNRLGSVTDPLGNVTTYAYDKLGRRVSQTDANGNTTTYKYNYKGQMIEAKDALGNTTTYTYGATGCPSCGGGVDKLTSLTDAKGQATSYQYDLLGRMTKDTDPLNKTINFAYDAAGNPQTKTDADGSTISYSYDALKRLTGKTYPDSTTESYTYNAAGRLQSVSNPNITYTYTYDAAGRITSAIDSRGYSLAYEYDVLGNRTKTTLQPGGPDQRVTSYGYDNANRMTTITTPAGTFTYGYDTLGRRTGLAYPNQIATNYTYDNGDRLTGISHTAGATTIAVTTYPSFDNTSNRKSKTTDNGTEQYSYDAIYRLTQAITSKGTERFTYDVVGNRLTGPGAKDTGYLYNAGNQMTKGRQFSYAYDNNGSQVERSIPAATDKSWNLSWDFENRLTKMEKTKGTTEKHTVTFKYDPLGRRIEKKLTTALDGVMKTSTWIYVYDNDNVAQEIYTDPSGTATKTWYTHGAGTDEHLALERNGSYYYYHSDGLGSITAITDASWNVLQSYTYDSFGMVKPSTSFRNSYTYTSREWDKETGLYYYRARYYDPMEGRFLSVDPVPFKNRTRDQLNSYAYTANNPINFTDPSGENIYGNWCGPGGSGPVKDGVDAICKNHDDCFDKGGVTWKNNVFGTGDKDKKQCISDCNKELCSDLMKYNFKTFGEYMGVLAIMSYFNCK